MEEIPLTQEDFEIWEDINLQAFSLEPPKPEETRLALYLIDVKRLKYKEFRHINEAIKALITRETSMIAFGSKGNDIIFKVILRWEQP